VNIFFVFVYITILLFDYLKFHAQKSSSRTASAIVTILVNKTVIVILGGALGVTLINI